MRSQHPPWRSAPHQKTHTDGGAAASGPRSQRVLHSDLAASRSLAGRERQRMTRSRRTRSGVAATGMQCSPRGTRGRGEGWSGAGRTRPWEVGVPGRADPHPGLARLRGRYLQHTPGGEMVSDGRGQSVLGAGDPARVWAGLGRGWVERGGSMNHHPLRPPATTICPGSVLPRQFRKSSVSLVNICLPPAISTHGLSPALGGQTATSKKQPPGLGAQRNPPLAESSAQMKRLVASCL